VFIYSFSVTMILPLLLPYGKPRGAEGEETTNTMR
jgi:hypothetical protein